MTAKEYQAVIRHGHKYNARQTIVNGIKFPSRAEADHYLENTIKVRNGLLRFFLRQVPFHLPGEVKFILDFLEVHMDWHLEFVEVKGFETELWKAKRKMVEALYQIKIQVVK